MILLSVLTRFSRKVFSIVDIFVPRIASSFSSVVVAGSEGKGDTPKEKKKDITRTSCAALAARLALKKLPPGIRNVYSCMKDAIY